MISSDEHASGSVTPPPSTTTAETSARPASAGAATAPALISRRAFEAWASAMVRRRLGNRQR